MTDVIVIGGGLLGLAVARALGRAGGASIAVVEAEGRLAAHQSGHNSGVIHAGLYYPPGSHKASFCTAGREALYRFCAEHRIPHRRSGKLVVATDEHEIARLDALAERGTANGLAGLRRLDARELRTIEPHVRGVGALWVPQTGVVDYAAVAEALAVEVRERGGEVLLGARVTEIRRRASGFVLRTTVQDIRARRLVNCAGLQADRIARMCGVRPALRIVPFRGEYHVLRPERRELVRGLVYPVPDPRLPFLGLHFTRRVDDRVELGPNAVLALRREGYRRGSFSGRDAWSTLSYPGFWRLAARHGMSGLGELWRSRSASSFSAAARRLVPELGPGDLAPGGAGVRAQAVSRDGRLVDDFQLLAADGALHVLNAPSPAATACLAIGAEVARRLGAGSGA